MQKHAVAHWWTGLGKIATGGWVGFGAWFAVGEDGAKAETVRLRSGVVVEGEWLNAGQTPRSTYEIRTPEGARVVFPADEVEKVEAPTKLETSYQRAVAKMPDTAEAHWKMQRICRTQQMPEQADFHLRRVLRLDPDHKEARALAGFVKDEQGEWVTQTELLSKRGYVYRDRSWISQQEATLLDYLEQTDNARRQWKHDLQRWRKLLDGRAGLEAEQNIRAVSDPAAVSALSALLDREEVSQYRRWYVESLHRINDNGSTQAILRAALSDPDPEIRELCVGFLQGDRKNYAVVGATRALQGNDPVLLNRAAYVLEQLNGQSGIRSLIRALTVTKQTIINTPGTQAGFDSNGGIGFSQGGGKIRHTEIIENEGVLAALKTLTGEDFGFDQGAWRVWYIERQTPVHINLRRDE